MKETSIRVELGGQAHKLVYNNYAIYKLEEYLGESVTECFVRLGKTPGALTVKVAASVVLAGLQHNEKFASGMTVKKACSLLPGVGLGTLAPFCEPIFAAIVKLLGYDQYVEQTEEGERAEHPTVCPSEATGASTGEPSLSSPAQPDADQGSSGA